jgi:outer membrane protein with beta-barrel domain
MRERHGLSRPTMILALGTILGMVLLTPWANAADSQRAGRSQFSFPIVFTSGSSYDSDFSSVDINDDVGWGIGFGWNVSEKVTVGGDFTWLDANYNVFVATDFDGDQISDDSIEVSGTLDATNFQMFAQYNILPSRITPFVRGSFGWTWIDSNIPNGPAQGACWWDPWWGYVCDTWQSTFSDTSFAYGAGAGIRAELGPSAFVEASYNILWIDFDKAGSQDFDGVRANIGWLF